MEYSEFFHIWTERRCRQSDVPVWAADFSACGRRFVNGIVWRQNGFQSYECCSPWRFDIHRQHACNKVSDVSGVCIHLWQEKIPGLKLGVAWKFGKFVSNMVFMYRCLVVLRCCPNRSRRYSQVPLINWLETLQLVLSCALSRLPSSLRSPEPLLNLLWSLRGRCALNAFLWLSLQNEIKSFISETFVKVSFLIRSLALMFET